MAHLVWDARRKPPLATAWARSTVPIAALSSTCPLPCSPPWPHAFENESSHRREFDREKWRAIFWLARSAATPPSRHGERRANLLTQTRVAFWRAARIVARLKQGYSAATAEQQRRNSKATEGQYQGYSENRKTILYGPMHPGCSPRAARPCRLRRRANGEENLVRSNGPPDRQRRLLAAVLDPPAILTAAGSIFASCEALDALSQNWTRRSRRGGQNQPSDGLTRRARRRPGRRQLHARMRSIVEFAASASRPSPRSCF